MALPAYLEDNMELKCLGVYSSPAFVLNEGQTTEALELTEERKQRMFEDYPGLFRKIEEETEFKIKTPEDNLELKTKGAPGRPKKA